MSTLPVVPVTETIFPEEEKARGSPLTSGLIGLGVGAVLGTGLGFGLYALFNRNKVPDQCPERKCAPKLAVFGTLNSSIGRSVIRAAQLAVNRYNIRNPCNTIVLDILDTEGDPARTTTFIQQLIDDTNYIGVIAGIFTSDIESFGGQLNETNIPMISPTATNVALANQGWARFHRVIANDDRQADGIVRLLRRTNRRVVATIHEANSSYSKDLYDLVNKQLVVPEELRFGPLAADEPEVNYDLIVDSIQARIETQNIDAIFISGGVAMAARLTVALRQAGVRTVLYFPDAVVSADYLRLVGRSGNGSFFSTGSVPPSFNSDFVSLYRDSAIGYGIHPDSYAAEAFDATQVFVDGIHDGVCTRDEMDDFLNAYDRPGITKQIKFDEKGEIPSRIIYVVKIVQQTFRAFGAV